MNTKMFFGTKIIIGLILIMLLQTAFAGGTPSLSITSLSVYESSTSTLSDGTLVCSNVNLTSTSSCGSNLETGKTYQFQVSITNSGAGDGKPEDFDFRSVVGNGDIVGSVATSAVNCGCYENASLKTGTDSISGSDLTCQWANKSECKISKNGDTEVFYFIVTIDTDAASGSGDYYVNDPGKSSDTSTTTAFTIVTPNNAPDITGSVSNDSQKTAGESITYTGSCSDADSGDLFRLIVCENGVTCNASTSGTGLICAGSNSTDTTPSCSLTTDAGDVGTNSGDIATCCDNDNDCDATTVSVSDWTITAAPVCGDNTKDASETCDGTDLDNQTCVLQGFDSGTLSCASNCGSFVTTSCVTNDVCGDNSKDAGETCDGTDLDNQTCVLQGFDSGTLSCASNCGSFVTTSCVTNDVCGDNTKDASETCDGTDLDNQTCVLQGFDSGTLSCAGTCDAFVTTSCVTNDVCGNNIKETSETCDGTDLDNQTCVTQDYDSGTLACSAGCGTFDFTGCVTDAVCGNSTKEAGEICDGSDLDSQTCVLQGFTSGTLACDSSCLLFNTTSCLGTTSTGICGNNDCESVYGEDYGNCKTDCATPKDITYTFYSPEENQVFAINDKVTIRVLIKGDSSATTGDEVTWVKLSSSPKTFNETVLYDDGEHEDGAENDGVFANSFWIGKDITAGTKTILIDTRIATTDKQATRKIIVDPTLSLSASTNKTNYQQGDKIRFEGIIARSGNNIATTVNAEILFDGEVIYDWNGTSDSEGKYFGEYQTTTISPTGEWTININAEDFYGNAGTFTKNINIFESKPFSALTVLFNTRFELPPKKGGRVKLEINVLDEYNEFVSGAEVELITAGNETIVLQENNGNYSTNYTIPKNSLSSTQDFLVKAVKRSANSLQRGEGNFSFDIAALEITIDLIEPTIFDYSAGEEINIKANISYPSGEPITQPVILATLGDRQITLIAIEEGVYTASYFISPSDEGINVLSLVVNDAFANSGTSNYNVVISGVSPMYWLRSYPATIGLAAGIIALFIAIIITSLSRKGNLKYLTRKKDELTKSKEDIQDRYYKQNTLKREDYNQYRAKYDSEIKATEKEIDRLEKKKKVKKNAK